MTDQPTDQHTEQVQDEDDQTVEVYTGEPEDVARSKPPPRPSRSKTERQDDFEDEPEDEPDEAADDEGGDPS